MSQEVHYFFKQDNKKAVMIRAPDRLLIIELNRHPEDEPDTYRVYGFKDKYMANRILKTWEEHRITPAYYQILVNCALGLITQDTQILTS
ncbi:hypothetical protein AHMF7605_10325 [Adhaeribacter arboris]|uniref:Uncharacterized protein n=1 Tax=Adhaeribacter arboris TaxID=2072846 RepID=A0A2T2YEH4_9BACT|nr:hypothetical protein [Adhaeribacter arboris]PSR53883.1 hypothetical protein AHMF7605_10325 [Adhaeribacter arboris]